MVWLPTNTAGGPTVREEGAGDYVSCVKDSKVVEEFKDICKLIRDFDAVLETRHISPEECFKVTEAARNAGEKIVITHPGVSHRGYVPGGPETDRSGLRRSFWSGFTPSLWAGSVQEESAGQRGRYGGGRSAASTLSWPPTAGQMQNPEWYNTIADVDYLYDAGFPARRRSM